MSHQLIVAIAIEVLFMLMTFFFLSTAKGRSIYQWAGSILLCVTFCWSVVLGCILALNDLTFRL